MWLRRMVAVFMIITCIGLNALTLLGILLPDKTKQVASLPQTTVTAASQSLPPIPTLTLSTSPSTIAAGGSSGLAWTTTGSPTSCTASGAWRGDKTPFGSESTGRIATSGNYVYALTCQNVAGKAVSTATVTVGTAIAPPKSIVTTTTPSPIAAPSATYCGGRTPCYGSHDVASHSGSGNCWGWNNERVINISGFDVAFHVVKSGISSIQISHICGHDLAPSLSGQVSAEGQSRNHNQSTKTNADSNEIPYFVGYFDPNKP